jgi:xanthine dehydrogenase accessory factor
MSRPAFCFMHESEGKVMTNACFPGQGGPPYHEMAVILGTNEIASAIAVHLHRDRCGVVLSHDPAPPVIRRKMAFHDALYDDAVTLDDVAARRADTGIEIRSLLRTDSAVIVTDLGLLDLIVLRSLDLLIDARMQKRDTTPDLRPLARFTIGVGPGFSGGANCHAAVETRPGKVGRILQRGSTDAADGVPRRLGGCYEERFVRAEIAGRWHTAIEIGTRVFKDFMIGHLGNVPVRAPFDGALRGVVRDGTEVPAGVKLLEIDPRGRRACWSGIDPRSQLIAKAVARAATLRETATPKWTAPVLQLVK